MRNSSLMFWAAHLTLRYLKDDPHSTLHLHRLLTSWIPLQDKRITSKIGRLTHI